MVVVVVIVIVVVELLRYLLGEEVIGTMFQKISIISMNSFLDLPMILLSFFISNCMYAQKLHPSGQTATHFSFFETMRKTISA